MIIRLLLTVVLAASSLLAADHAVAACSLDPNTGGSSYTCSNEGEARAAAEAKAWQTLQSHCAMQGGGGSGEYGTAKKEANYWQPGWHCVSAQSGASLGISYNNPIYKFSASCATAPPLPSGTFQLAPGPICNNGCEYSSGGTGNTTTTLFPGTAEEMQFQDRHGGNTPTGQTCSMNAPGPKPLTQETCKTVGTLTQCMMPNGKHCAQASTGKKFCWNPTEAGTKVSGNDGATKAPSTSVNKPPPVPPTNNGEWQQTGSGSTTINNNGATTNYNTNTYQSSNGGTGTGGGATNPDGSEEPGQGGDDGDDHGAPQGGDGDLYDGIGDKTVGTVFSAFKDRVSDAPVIEAIGDFFTVQGGGACPVFTIPGNEFWESMTYDAHCSGTFLSVLQSMGWVILAGVALLAAYWALS